MYRGGENIRREIFFFTSVKYSSILGKALIFFETLFSNSFQKPLVNSYTTFQNYAQAFFFSL